MSEPCKIIDIKSRNELDLDEIRADDLTQSEALRILDQFRDLVLRGQIVQVAVVGVRTEGGITNSWSSGPRYHQLVSGVTNLQYRLQEETK